MQAKIIAIGNSQGIRIPKILLEQSGLGTEVELEVSPGELKILPRRNEHQLAQMSQDSLAVDWDKPEEDEAWENL